MLPPPTALLLDFGGVIADAPPQRTAPSELVLRVFNLTRQALPPGEIQRSLTEGAEAYARWRDEDHPDELPQAQVWERFVIDGWPAGAQARVRAQIAKLSYEWAWRHNWALRPGIADTLDFAADRNLPLAVVSNTLSGAAHRDFLEKAGVAGRFAVQIYSDEAGVRKPNPQMIWEATDALGVHATDCWFVGDSRRRDILCGRRADVRAAILMRSLRTGSEGTGREGTGREGTGREGTGAGDWPDPDATVDDGFGLLDLLTAAF